MIISKKFKFIFLAPPKTGTRSIYRLLLNDKFSGELVGDHKHIIPSKYSEYFTFIVVRNPYYRMLSLYLSCCIENGDVKGFVKDMETLGFSKSFNSFLKWVILNRSKFYDLNESKYLILKSQCAFFLKNKVSKLIRYENLDKEFKSLSFITDEDKLPFINKTKVTTDKLTWFDNETIQLINEYCLEEFALLDYKIAHSIEEFELYYS